VKIELARFEDLDAVLDILSGAARWLRERGIEQWPDPFPRSRVEDSLARGELYLARVDKSIAATFVLQWEDELFWGEQPPVAGYIHAVAVRREHAGVGRQVIEWAERAVREAGRPFLRLDCMRDNPRIRSYYEALGFEHRGDRLVGGQFDASLYEKSV
jgi:ribosomal protein S18 acetylase RimI-like enzyme